MFDLVNKAKKFLNQNQDTSDEFILSQEEVDRILKEEIDDKFEALEKEHAAKVVAEAKEEERNQFATKLREEALLRRQVLQDTNSTTSQIQQTLQTLSKTANNLEIVELQNLLNTLGEVRANSSHTDEAMAQFLVNCNLQTEAPKRLSIDEQLNMIESDHDQSKIDAPSVQRKLSIEEQMNLMSDSQTPISNPNKQTVDDVMNSLFQSTMTFNDTQQELSELELLKKAMGF